MAPDRMSGAPQCRVFATPEALANEVADWIGRHAREAPRRFALCLSGGTTPRRVYQLLGAEPRRDDFPWQRTHWFWGDERFVPHDDARSNFHMAWEALLRHVPVLPDNVHAIPTEQTTPGDAARTYEAMLRRFYGADTLQAGRPLFDLILLGLGEDGHTASLFPGSSALAETDRWVVPVTGPDKLERITLTYPALASSAATAFLVVGESKRTVLERALADGSTLPAARLRPTGVLYWFADRAAAPMPAHCGVC
jgi:6-phosphogluconolactonase